MTQSAGVESHPACDTDSLQHARQQLDNTPPPRHPATHHMHPLMVLVGALAVVCRRVNWHALRVTRVQQQQYNGTGSHFAVLSKLRSQATACTCQEVAAATAHQLLYTLEPPLSEGRTVQHTEQTSCGDWQTKQAARFKGAATDSCCPTKRKSCTAPIRCSLAAVVQNNTGPTTSPNTVAFGVFLLVFGYHTQLPMPNNAD